MQLQIDGLLSFSTVNKLDISEQSIDLNRLAQTVVKDLSVEIKTLCATVKIGPLPNVVGNTSLLYQVFYNIIQNGLKYQAPGVSPEIIIVSEKTNNAHEISVIDNGIGIAPAYRDKIFKMFSRLHTQKSYQGTGIGLGLCHRIIERHGGRIWVEERHDKKSGSCFKFTLPIFSTQ